MINIEKEFEKFGNANFFSRVDNTHPLELYIGLDEKGNKAIELRAKFSPHKITGTSAIAVNQYGKSEYNTLRFSLYDEEISGLFYKFCEDLIEQTRDIKERTEGYLAISRRFFQWKKMFVPAKGNLLTEPEIMGLIGELLYLKGTLSQRLGLTEAMKSWSGQELTHKDFSFNDEWVEVKAISRGAQNVKISSLEQLDSDVTGELAVFSLEKMSKAYHGIKLNDLVIEIRNMFVSDDDKEEFMSKVALQGYEYNNYYDEFVYEVSTVKRYVVDEYFPKLTTRGLPLAICKASYELNLKEIAEFELKQ